MSSLSLNDARTLLGSSPSSGRASSWVERIASCLDPPWTGPLEAEGRTYHDAVYLNYYLLGLSLLFVPVDGYKPADGTPFHDLDIERLSLDSLDIYNATPPNSRSTPAKQPYSPCPAPSLTLALSEVPDTFQIQPTTRGKDFVQALGEPERKGGGSGPASGSIGIWCEWTRYGLMVEFGGNDAKGPQAWERGKEARWKVLTLFELGRSVTS